VWGYDEEALGIAVFQMERKLDESLERAAHHRYLIHEATLAIVFLDRVATTLSDGIVIGSRCQMDFQDCILSGSSGRLRRYCMYSRKETGYFSIRGPSFSIHTYCCSFRSTCRTESKASDGIIGTSSVKKSPLCCYFNLRGFT
jgi:hypothetical protein